MCVCVRACVRVCVRVCVCARARARVVVVVAHPNSTRAPRHACSSSSSSRRRRHATAAQSATPASAAMAFPCPRGLRCGPMPSRSAGGNTTFNPPGISIHHRAHMYFGSHIGVPSPVGGERRLHATIAGSVMMRMCRTISALPGITRWCADAAFADASATHAASFRNRRMLAQPVRTRLLLAQTMRPLLAQPVTTWSQMCIPS